jgi:hypothetical protein
MLAHLAQANWMRENIPEARIAVRVNTLLGMVAAARTQGRYPAPRALLRAEIRAAHEKGD